MRTRGHAWSEAAEAVDFSHNSPPALTYAIVMPARNERDNIERVAGSIIAQECRPTWWVIVDDGSDDGMDVVGTNSRAGTHGSSTLRPARAKPIWRRDAGEAVICSHSGTD